MVVLAVNSLFMPGAKEGLEFYLVPDFARMQEVGVVNTLVSAMNQAFFTPVSYTHLDVYKRQRLTSALYSSGLRSLWRQQEGTASGTSAGKTVSAAGSSVLQDVYKRQGPQKP